MKYEQYFQFYVTSKIKMNRNENSNDQTEKMHVLRRVTHHQSVKENRWKQFGNKRISLQNLTTELKQPSSKEFCEIASLIKTKDKVNLKYFQKLNSGLQYGEDYIKIAMSVDGFLQRLISEFSGKNPDHQLAAACCLTNLATGAHKVTYRIAKEAGIYLISYLNSSSVYLQEQCLWTIGNIAADCEDCCKVLQSQGFLTVALSLLSNDSLASSCYYSLSSFFSNMWKFDVLTPNQCETLFKFKSEISSSHAWILFYLSCNNFYLPNHTDNLSNYVVTLNLLLDNEKKHISRITPLLRVVGNIVNETIIHHPDLILLMTKLLSSSYVHLNKEGLWVLGNLLNKVSKEQQSKLFPELHQLVEKAYNVVEFTQLNKI